MCASLSPVKMPQIDYYVNLDMHDYYFRGMVEPGRWLGRGARSLGLSGPLSKAVMQRLLEGTHPWTGAHLVQNRGADKRQCGWDLTLSAPKPVSVFAAFCSEAQGREIGLALSAASLAVVDIMERHWAFTRRGKGGYVLERVGLVVAEVPHISSRSQDPQWHRHLVVINCGITASGHTGALVSKWFYENKLLIGRIYRDVLAAELERRLGVVIEREEVGFKILGIADELLKAFSTRRRAIESALAARGQVGAAAAAAAAVITRPAKTAIGEAELFRNWHDRAVALGFEPKLIVEQALEIGRRISPPPMRIEDSVREQIKTVVFGLNAAATALQTTATALSVQAQSGLVFQPISAKAIQHPDLRMRPAMPNGKKLPIDTGRESEPIIWSPEPKRIRFRDRLVGRLFNSAARSQWVGLPAIKLMAHLAIVLTHSRLSHFSIAEVLGNARRHPWFKGVPFHALESAVERRLSNGRRFMQLSGDKRARRFTSIRNWRLEQKLLKMFRRGRHAKLQPVGELAISMALLRAGNISKDQMAAVVRLWNRRGQVQVLEGLAGTGKAKVLKAANEAWSLAGYHVVGAALSGKAERELGLATGIDSRTTSLLIKQLKSGRLRISSKSIVVLDEASMLDIRQLVTLTERVVKAGAKLVLVGDPRQIQPVTSGHALAAAKRSSGRIALTDIRRQREPWVRGAINRFATGNAIGGLDAFTANGCTCIRKSPGEAVAKLVEEWFRFTRKGLRDHVVLCSTSEEAKELNRAIQNERRVRGQLGKTGIRRKGQDFHRGDRVVFTRNNYKLDVRNGELASVVGVVPVTKHLFVRCDDGRFKVIPLWTYPHVILGMAITTHRAQGITTATTQVWLSRHTTPELAYVQASRSRGETRFYGDDETRQLLQMTLKKPAVKTLAVDVAHRTELRSAGRAVTY